MTTDKVSEMSQEELKVKELNLKKWLPFFLIIILFLTGISAYLTITQGIGAFTALPVVFIGLYISKYKSLKSIQKELAIRSK